VIAYAGLGGDRRHQLRLPACLGAAVAGGALFSLIDPTYNGIPPAAAPAAVPLSRYGTEPTNQMQMGQLLVLQRFTHNDSANNPHPTS
jgi:hypothetical protein